MRILAALALLLVALGLALFLALRPPAPLGLPARGAVLDGVTLVEPGASRRPGMRLVVEGNAIASVATSPAGSGPFAGMVVLPGLNDLHVHYPPPSLPGQTELFAFLHLRYGVTAVRDAGDTDGASSGPAREGIAAGRFPGPRSFACGPFVDGDAPLWANSLRATTAAEGRAAVERVAEAGFDCVKAYSSLGAEALAGVREEARARGLPVIGHGPERVGFEAARLDDAQHLIGVPPPPSDPTLRFPLILRAWRAVDDARLAAIARASLAHGIAHTPTLVTTDRLIAQQDLAAARAEPDARLLPRFYREVVWGPEGLSAARGLGPEDFAMLRDAQAGQLRAVKALFDAGVELHSGTDTLIAFVVPGASLHRELRLLVRAGLTPEQALAISTRTSARFLGVPGLGELRPGAPAELVIFRDDPTRSLDALDTLAGVVRDGRLYTREALDAQMARYRAHFDGAVYDAVVTPIVRRVLARTPRASDAAAREPD